MGRDLPKINRFTLPKVVFYDRKERFARRLLEKLLPQPPRQLGRQLLIQRQPQQVLLRPSLSQHRLSPWLRLRPGRCPPPHPGPDCLEFEPEGIGDPLRRVVPDDRVGDGAEQGDEALHPL